MKIVVSLFGDNINYLNIPSSDINNLVDCFIFHWILEALQKLTF